MIVKRLVISLLGAVVLFTWGFVGHAVIRMYDPAFDGFSDEAEVAAALATNAARSGIYYLPHDIDYSAEQAEAFVNYVAAGERTSLGLMMLFGFAIQATTVFLVLTLLGAGPVGYWRRVGSLALAGVTIAFAVHGYYWNWFDFPGRYFGIAMLDAAIGWTLAGLVLGGMHWGSLRGTSSDRWHRTAAAGDA